MAFSLSLSSLLPRIRCGLRRSDLAIWRLRLSKVVRPHMPIEKFLSPAPSATQRLWQSGEVEHSDESKTTIIYIVQQPAQQFWLWGITGSSEIGPAAPRAAFRPAG